ncbi:MAG: cadherin-like domain-containing protein, partial [Dehalococcoidia bacterium]|nr:cadherin-like domain-containing protein [Dehalococcoidia bacterium]
SGSVTYDATLNAEFPLGTTYVDNTATIDSNETNPVDDDERVVVVVAECETEAFASNNGPVCQGEAVQLFGLPNGMVSYSWTGPQGFSSTQQNPIRSPAVAGTYTLVVTDADECAGVDTTLVVVNPLPDCTITAPSPVFSGSTNTASVTPAGGTYFWSVTGEGTLAGGQNTPSITWTAGAEGTATISVTVTDVNGCESSCIRTVTVRPTPTPTPPPPSCSPEIQLAVLLDGSSTMNSTEWQTQLDGLSEAILDPECMPDCYVELTVIQFAGEIRGDARTEIPPTVINSDNRDEVAQDVLDIVKSGGITPMEAGINRAVDELRSSIYFSPALKQIINISSDVQENTLDRPAIEEARDAATNYVDEISAEGVGDFRIPEDQDWMQNRIVHPGFPTGTGNIAPYSWDPGWVYAVGIDADKFKEAICHKIGLTNYAPVAIDDAYSVDEDTPLTVSALFGVLANDTDADGDTLAAILVSDVGHGTLTLNTDGSFSYTPSAGFTGSDSFTYKANDGTDDSNVATVTITVDPIGPGPGPGRVAYIVIEPDGAEITAGATQPYTASAFDASDNYIGDVTDDTVFSIIEAGDGGSWVGNVYTSQYAGTWTVIGTTVVPGTYDGMSDWATLTVIAGSLDHIVISADTDTITAGDTLAFSAEAFD